MAIDVKQLFQVDPSTATLYKKCLITILNSDRDEAINRLFTQQWTAELLPALMQLNNAVGLIAELEYLEEKNKMKDYFEGLNVSQELKSLINDDLFKKNKFKIDMDTLKAFSSAINQMNLITDKG